MKEYRITKVDAKGNESDCGIYTDIYEVIPKNYKLNGLFYEASNTKQIYVTTEILRDGNGKIFN